MVQLQWPAPRFLNPRTQTLVGLKWLWCESILRVYTSSTRLNLLDCREPYNVWEILNPWINNPKDRRTDSKPIKNKAPRRGMCCIHPVCSPLNFQVASYWLCEVKSIKAVSARRSDRRVKVSTSRACFLYLSRCICASERIDHRASAIVSFSPGEEETPRSHRGMEPRHRPAEDRAHVFTPNWAKWTLWMQFYRMYEHCVQLSVYLCVCEVRNPCIIWLL